MSHITCFFAGLAKERVADSVSQCLPKPVKRQRTFRFRQQAKRRFYRAGLQRLSNLCKSCVLSNGAKMRAVRHEQGAKRLSGTLRGKRARPVPVKAILHISRSRSILSPSRHGSWLEWPAPFPYAQAMPLRLASIAKCEDGSTAA